MSARGALLSARLGRVVLLTAFALAACRSDRQRAQQAQLLLLAEHIERLRQADNADKRALLTRLTELDCEGTSACALKDLCVRAYTVHQGVLDTIGTLRRSRDASTPELRAAFAATEAQLAQAKALTESCADAQVRAVRDVLM